ncbi:MAG: M1 family metallopeptidase [Clostridia bacterium]
MKMTFFMQKKIKRAIHKDKKQIVAGVLILALLSVAVAFVSCGTPFLQKVAKEVTNYKMNLEYIAEEKSISGTCSVDFFNNLDVVVEQIPFHLHPNAYREDATLKPVGLADQAFAFPHGKSFGDIKIQNVKNGITNLKNKICGDDQNILLVDLGQKVYPDSRFEVEITFTTKLANINHRLGYGDNTINLCNFFPIVCAMKNNTFVQHPYNSNGDPFFSEVSNYDVSISYPSSLALASTGTSTTTQFNSIKTSNITGKSVRDFAIIISSNFEIATQNYNGIQVSYYGNGKMPATKMLNIAVDAVKDFEFMFGKYPYPSLAVVNADFCHGGMEYPMLVMISSSINDVSTYEMVIVHEIAHQWWYGVVGNDQFNHGWLDEGLAEYSTALFYKDKNKTITYEQLIANATNNYTTFVKAYKNVLEKVDTSIDRPIDKFKTSQEYVNMAYVKSMLMFESLHNLIGDKKFFKTLKIYYNENAFKISSPEILMATFKNETRTDLDTFFDSWINGKVEILAT